jgi:hypothetical protein
MSDEQTIVIFNAATATLGTDGRPIQARGVVEKLQEAAEVGVEQLERNFTTFVTGVAHILNKAQNMTGEFKIDKVEIEVMVTADGKVGLAGSSVGLSGKSSLKLILCRESKETGTA